MQKRTSPVKFAHLAEKSEKGSISNLSTKVDATAAADRRVEEPSQPAEGSEEAKAKLWSQDEVVKWITEVSHGRLAYLGETFAENCVDGEVLFDINEENCADLCVELSHRKMLIREIEKLRGAAVLI